MTHIALVGGGNIGGTLAHLISQERLGTISLIDTNSDLAQGKSLDMAHAAPLKRSISPLAAKSLDKADVVIITAGVARKPGMTRDDLLHTNASIICAIAQDVRMYCPEAFVILVTNPLDAMAWLFHKESSLPYTKVVGMAGLLDSARFRYYLGQELKISPQHIHTLVLGNHGDSMVPLLQFTSIEGVPLTSWLDAYNISMHSVERAIERTRHAGAEVVSLLGSGSAFYAPATAALEMARAYIQNEGAIMPCSVYSEEAYGLPPLYLGLPTRIDKKGATLINNLPLLDKDIKALQHSASLTQTMIDYLNTGT